MKYRILFKDKIDKEILRTIKNKHSHELEGLESLYDFLIEDGVCDSQKPALIYYLAYTLALENIEIIIVRLD